MPELLEELDERELLELLLDELEELEERELLELLLDELDELDERELLELLLDELDERELLELLLDELGDRELLELLELLLDELDDRELLELLLDELGERELLELLLDELGERELLELLLDELGRLELLLDEPGGLELDDPTLFVPLTPPPLPSAFKSDGEVGVPPPHPTSVPLAVSSAAPPESRMKNSRRFDDVFWGLPAGVALVWFFTGTSSLDRGHTQGSLKPIRRRSNTPGFLPRNIVRRVESHPRP